MNDIKSVSVEGLIGEFEEMADRGTLLNGSNVTQEDILVQIVGTIINVARKER